MSRDKVPYTDLANEKDQFVWPQWSRIMRPPRSASIWQVGRKVLPVPLAMERTDQSL